ncbi:unnamed protein product [Closterium sp. NIES-53]
MPASLRYLAPVRPACYAAMASLRVTTFDHEGHLIQFDTWLDDLQLYLLSDSSDGVSLFDHKYGASPAPPATADSATRSQWLTRDAAARLAIRNHLPLAKCAHFRQHRTAQALYDAVFARYSLPATPALGHLLLPYLFPELSTFATVEDLVNHLRTNNARYNAALPTDFLERNPSPMYITLNFIVTRLPDSLRAVRDHFLALDPTALTVDLLEQHLLLAEKSVVAIGAPHGTPRTPFFEDVLVALLVAPSNASTAAVNVLGAEDVEAASASEKRRSSKGKGGRGGGGGSRGGGGGGSGGGGGNGGGGSDGSGGGSRCFGGGDGGSGGGGVAIFDLDYNAILSTMYALSISAEVADLGIEATALGASESALSSTARGEALHTFTLDSGCDGHYHHSWGSSCVNLHVYHTGRHLAMFTRRPGSSLSTLATEPPQVAASAQVSASGPVSPPRWCRLLSHQTLLWHHRLGQPSLPRLRGMHSCLIVSGLPRSLPPLQPSPAPPCLPCIEGRQRAAPHSSFPPTSAPPQTLHMDVWGPARVSGLGREHYFLLVVDDYTCYTTVFPLRSKGGVPDVLIPWIRTVRLQLRERFRADLPILRLQSDRGVEFSSDLLRDFCHGEGILLSFTLPTSPQQNEIAERRIGLVMESATLRISSTSGPESPCRRPRRQCARRGRLVMRRCSGSRALLPLFAIRPRTSSPPALFPASSLASPLTRPAGTYAMALHPSSVPLRIPLPPTPESFLPAVPDPDSNLARAASPTVSCLLATIVTDPSFESTAASALVTELVDCAAACRLDYATALVAESESASPPSIRGECGLGTDVLEDRLEDLECLAAAVPRFASMLFALEGDPDAPDIPTPRSYAEAITGPYSSQWQAAMDAEMASWKSTGTYVDAVPPSRANIVDGMWIFKGSLHEEIWLRRPTGFTGSFPAGTQWSLRQPVYRLRQAPREWHDTLRTTLAALGFNPSTADFSLFLRIDTSLPPFYVLLCLTCSLRDFACTVI